MKKLLVAAIAVLMASPAFAAVQNVKVSGDITSTYIDRQNFDLGIDNGNDGGAAPASQPLGLKNQSVFITQTRVRVDADLTDNVSTTVGLINERAWNGENGSNNDSLDTNVQLYLASVTMRELLYSPLTVTVGKQVFNYGNGLIMGDGGANNVATGNLHNIAQDFTLRTSYDGVKAILDYKPLTIDMFYFKNTQTNVTGLIGGGGVAPGVPSYETSSDVYGLNANYQLNDPMSTVVEGYVFSRIGGDASFGVPGSTGTVTDKGDTLYVPGLRASTNPIKDLNIQGEVAWQLGNHPVVPSLATQEAEHRDAFAAQFLASYSLPVLDKYKPTVNASYTYVSGDKNGGATYGTDSVPSTKHYSAWDPFNEAQGSGTIYNTLFNLTNMHILSAGASVTPLQDVTASVTWSGLFAAQRYNNTTNALTLVQPDSSGNVGGNLAPITSNKLSLGNEYDANLSYAYTEDVTFGLSVGWFVPGDTFIKGNRDVASQALASVGVKF